MARTLVAQTVSKIGEKVTLSGWVDTKRDHGKITFIDLRDRSGVVQLVGGKSLKNAHPEDVITVMGMVKERTPQTINSNLITGKVEVEVLEISFENRAQALPFPIDNSGYDIEEELRLKYRYLDLRRSRLQQNIKMRSRFVDLVRQGLYKQDFVEIETPILTKSTPEGSRDFLVPSRLNPGNFYALPQSPQQYKQLLMVGGFERYFQIARCIRDEDLRADRGFEHTQIDIEMSFVTQKDVMDLIESLMTDVYEKMGFQLTHKPFPVIPYSEAMAKYGADKFDMRSDEQKAKGEMAFAWVVNFPFFEKTESDGWTFTHNPFSAPIPEHKEWLLEKKNIGDIITAQYDLVCNGYEVGGGSIRSHQPEILQTVFEIMGYSKASIEDQFGHMLNAFRYGAPPHGGIALGVERHLMLMRNEEALREVVAFPMTGKGNTAVMNAPSPVTSQQLEELSLEVKIPQFDSPYEHILHLLNSQKIKHSLYEHDPVFTSEAAAKARQDTSLSQGAKALVLDTNEGLILYVLPADQKADLKGLKVALNFNKVALASKETVESKTGLGVGSIPPFGSVIGLKTYVDEKLGQNQEIAFNAARHDRSIKMKFEDYMKVENPKVVALK